jgi:hypothetical protein
MDADKRHQLRQNELAEALGRLRDFTDRRTVVWGLVILAIALGYGGYKLWKYRESRNVIASYRTLNSLNAHDVSLGEAPLTQLRQLVANSRQPALIALARLQLAQGLEARAEQADDPTRLAEAQSQYQTIVDMPDVPPHIRAAAMYRLGVLHETQRDFAQARQTYESLSRDARYEGSPFQELAVTRLEHLDDWAVPIAFRSGSKPLPTTQPIPHTRGKLQVTGSAADKVTISPVPGAPTSQPATGTDRTDTETSNVPPPTESRQPQQP